MTRPHYGDDRDEYIPTERTGIIVYTLMRYRGRKFTTAYLADLVGLTHGAAWYQLDKLQRVIPICQEIDGWVIY